MLPDILLESRVHRWGGIAFVFGNLLFFGNKINEMSRLFLGRWMPDLISGQNPLLILLGQVALIVGFALYYQFYAQRTGRMGRMALRLFAIGGIVLALGHVSFMTQLLSTLPALVAIYAEYLFLLVVFGLLFSLTGLIWFGILNLRQPIVSRWLWLPLVTGLMGFIGFFFFSGEEITALFLFFRTLFALGLVGLGIILWQEKPMPLQGD
jgi:hypothetical protein